MSEPININQVTSVLTKMKNITDGNAVQSNTRDSYAVQRDGSLSSRFTWLSDITDDEDSKVKWICKGLFGRGLITLLSGNPKDGKTTFISQLCLAIEKREEFLGLPVEETKVLIITEEDKASWYRKKLRIGLSGRSVGIIPRYLYNKNQSENWETAINEVKELCLSEMIGMVVIDPISYFWGINSENDANDVTNALKPLHTLCSAGISVVLVHHDRKSSGTNVTGVRGSSAITSFADIILGLAKNESRSVLTSDGRYEETPARLCFRLADDESHFELLESLQATNVSQEQKLEDILSYIPFSPEGLTKSEIIQKWVEDTGVLPPNPSTVSRWLALGESKGVVEVTGQSEQRGKAELWGRVVHTDKLADEFEPNI